MEEAIDMKAEYDLRTMSRKGHPLREKAKKGKIKLVNPLDIPDYESKLGKLSSDEKKVIADMLDTCLTR